MNNAVFGALADPTRRQLLQRLARKSFDGNSLGWGEAAALIKFCVEHGVSYW